jgi:DNA-binding NarL/FixJ family response regulator
MPSIEAGGGASDPGDVAGGAAAADPGSAPAATTHRLGVMQGLGILVVEDDPKFRDAFVRVLGSAPDMRLLGAAANGAEARALLAQHEPDVLLVDLGLPDENGLEIIRQAARQRPDCDIMVITVFGDERHVIESIEAGASGYLLKDTMPDDFVEQIRVLHAGGSPISPTIARQLLTRFKAPAPAAETAPVAAAATAGAGAEATVPAPGPAAPAGDGPDGVRAALSEREHTVLGLVMKGFTCDEIAGLLSVSRHTVMTYVKRVYRKLQVNSRTEAVYEARRMGLIRE